MYLPVLREEISQGDLFDGLVYQYVYLGEVRPLSEISIGTRGNVRSRRVFYTFPLEPHDNLPEESYVDFRRILRFDKSRIAGSHSNQQRLLSLTDIARTALQEQVSLFFGLAR